MDPYRNNKEWSGCAYSADLWAPYRGIYPEPTHEELQLIKPFLVKFHCEDDDFDEDIYFDEDDYKNRRWISFKERLRIPNLRSELLKFLAQVRRSKGYEVDLYFDFSVVRGWEALHVFVPCSLDEQRFRDEATAATKFAIGEINANTRRNYEVVSVDKLVSTTDSNLLLLSFTAKEIRTADDSEAFQAMVQLNQTAAAPFKLREWKFRPRPILPCMQPQGQ